METNVGLGSVNVKSLLKGRAAVLKNVGADYEMSDVYYSEIQEDEVLVKLVATGICHSDEAVRKGFQPSKPPLILGHEGSGIIEKVGEKVKGFEVGDHVVLSYRYCGTCSNCLTGVPASCVDYGKLNFKGVRADGTPYCYLEDGTPVMQFMGQSSFASHSIVNVSSIIKVDKSVDLRLVGPLGCGFMAGSGTVFNALKPKPGSTIAIFGTGAVGLSAMMAAKIAGCSKIIGIDIHDNRLELAKQLGATHVINSKEENVEKTIKKLTNGLGVNYSIDTSGVSAVMKTAIDILAIGGVAAPIAASQDLKLNPMLNLSLYNRTVKGVLMGQAIPQLSIPKLIEYYLDDRFGFDKLIQVYSLEDINKANEDAHSGKVVKPILIMDESYKPE